jgi:phosphotransferase family enzyme
VASVESYLPEGLLAEFVDECLPATPSSKTGGRHARQSAEVVPVEGRGNVTEYRYQGYRIIAKVYTEGQHHDGLRAYRISQTLWDQGFGPGSVHRVPEPLAYLGERRTFLMEAASGDRLRAIGDEGGERWADGLRTAARWLAELHTSSVRVGAADQWRDLFRMARWIARASARHPELEGTLTALVDDLGHRAGAISERGPQPTVQTHGRYHTGHVYVAPRHVTVIDLDRAAPSDPAKDVAELLSRVRGSFHAKGLDDNLAEHSIRIFLEEYERNSHVRSPALLYYWSLSVLTTMLHTMCKGHLDDEARKVRVAFFESEFRHLPRRISSYGLPA